MNKQSLLELYNSIANIAGNPGNQNLDPDTKWYQDLLNLGNVRDIGKDSPTHSAHYAPPTDSPNMRNIFDKNGKPNISAVVRALAQALYIQSQKPSLQGLDDIIHKLEKIIIDYRDDLEEIPTYRANIVRTKDSTQMLNNLIYGPYEPPTKLAVMVSDLDPNSSNMDLPEVKVDTNAATNDYQQDSPNAKVNSQEADRVNVPQKGNDGDNALKDMADLFKDMAIKTAQLAAQQNKSKQRDEKFEEGSYKPADEKKSKKESDKPEDSDKK